MAKSSKTDDAKTIEPGKAAPAFHLPDQAGDKHRLSQYKGRWVVLYFYPKDSTPGCTTEACDFRDAQTGLKQRDAVVLGVSPDGEASKAKFAGKHELNFPILADEGATVCQKYGVWQEKSMYGRTFMGVVRTTYLIDPSGKVARRFDKVKVKAHADAVLAALDELRAG
ncbi:MAG: thioredoxin-dependent thiol peroxidase [Phycisphaeraceae bacterium]